MKIEVIDTPRGRRFLWIDKNAFGNPLECTAEQLAAPDKCESEKIEIRRGNNVLVPSGEIRWVGTHADGPCFCFLGPFGDYRQQLSATEFEVSDEIIISPSTNREPMRYFDRLYWSSMMMLGYGPETKLYRKMS